MKRLIFTILLLLFAWPCWAIDYYTRPHVTDAACTYGACDGTSYADAWEGFTGGDGTPVNWATVDAGNGKLFVAGTHYESLAVDADGESDHYIHIISCTIANGASTDDAGTINMTAAAGAWIDDSANFAGAAVWKQTLTFRPGILLLDDYVVHGKNNTDMDAVGYNTDFERATGSTIVYFAWDPVSWWEPIDVLWGAKDAGAGNYTVYIRFRDDTNPNTQTIRIGNTAFTTSKCIDIQAYDYVEIEDLTLKGGYYGINTDATATNIIVDGCTIDHARSAINIIEGSATIQNCTITLKYHGDKNFNYLGCGEGSSAHDRYHLYYTMKFTWSNDDVTYGMGVSFGDATTGIISNNTIYGLGNGIKLYGKDSGNYTDGVDIYDNTLADIISVGLILSPWVKDVDVYRNKFVDNYIGIRLHAFDTAGNTTWEVLVYSNIISTPSGMGYGMYLHSLGIALPDPTPVLTFLNNSINGPNQFMVVECHLVDAAAGYLGRFSIDNNIIQSTYFATGSMQDENSSTLLSCDYNYILNDDNADYIDAHCIEGSTPQFTDAAGDDFTLQPISPCINTGTNLGASYDDGLYRESTWPDNVTTLDQDLYGPGWEMGAYVFDQTIKLQITGSHGTHSGLTVDATGEDYGLIVVGDTNTFTDCDITGSRSIIAGDSNTLSRCEFE